MIEIFISDTLSSSQCNIFLSSSVSFSVLTSQIHQRLQKLSQRNINLYIYISLGTNIESFDLLENFEILFNHSLVKDITFVIDSQNSNFNKIDRTMRFMHDVYEYKVFTRIAEYQMLQTTNKY